MNMLGVHWQPYHRSAHDTEWFAWLRPPVVKVVGGRSLPYVEDIPATSLVLARLWDAERDFRHLLATNPVECARRHVDYCAQAAQNLMARGIPLTRQAYESINEPRFWADEPPANVNIYSREFLLGLHTIPVGGCTPNAGVGWPDNVGTGTPPDWRFYADTFAVMRPGDYLGLHEYWYRGGCGENWGWWAGRCLQMPRHVPMIITECGVDSMVATSGPHQGYQSAYGSMPLDAAAARFVNEKWDYQGRLAQDIGRRVRAILPFTHDSAVQYGEWHTFDVRNEPMEYAIRQKVAREGWIDTGEFHWKTPPVGREITHLEDELAWHETKRWPIRDTWAIDSIVVHHTAVVPLSDEEAWTRYHIGRINYIHIRWDWARISYHFIIDRSGRIWQVNRASHVVGHSGSREMNQRSIGICLLGNWARADPPEAQIDALHWLRAQLGYPATGHYNVVATQCPGPWWRRVADRVNGPYAPAPPPPTPPPPPSGVTFTHENIGSLTILKGNHPTPGTMIYLSNGPNGSGFTWEVEARHKPEFGPGGYEFSVTPGPYWLIHQGETQWIPVELQTGVTTAHYA